MLAQEVRNLEHENEVLRQAIIEMRDKFEKETVKPKCCDHCKYFVHHYILSEGSYVPIHTGHCGVGRSTKKRNTEDTCKSFEMGTYGIRWLNA